MMICKLIRALKEEGARDREGKREKTDFAETNDGSESRREKL